MAYQRFSLFPDSPSFKDFFSARSMRYRWRNGDPVITVTIMAICVAVWIVETLLKIVWPTGCNAFVGSGVFMPALATHRPWTFITSMFLHQPASLWHIHHRRSVRLAVGFRSACVARQKPAAAHADVRRNHVGRDYCDCRRMQYEQSTSRKPPSWHVLLVGRKEKNRVGESQTHTYPQMWISVWISEG